MHTPEYIEQRMLQFSPEERNLVRDAAKISHSTAITVLHKIEDTHRQKWNVRTQQLNLELSERR